MQSMEGEVVDLAPNVRITEQIETWLGDLTRSMKNTLQQQNEVLCAGRMNDEFRAAASQCLQLKEAIAFTEKWVGRAGAGHRGTHAKRCSGNRAATPVLLFFSCEDRTTTSRLYV